MSTAKLLGFHTFRFLYGRKWTMLHLGLYLSQLRKSLRFQQTWIIWTALNGISGRHFNYTHRFSKFLTVDLNDSSVICCPNWFSSRSIPLKTSFLPQNLVFLQWILHPVAIAASQVRQARSTAQAAWRWRWWVKVLMAKSTKRLPKQFPITYCCWWFRNPKQPPGCLKAL